MAKTRPVDQALRDGFAAVISERLKNQSAAEIAAALKVKRQTVYLYRDATITPGGDVIRRAFEAWPNLVIPADRMLLTRQSFPQKTKKMYLPPPVQMTLWQALEQLKDHRVEVKVPGKKGNAFVFELRVTIAS